MINNSIIIFVSGIISLILFLLMQYKSDLLSDRQLITVFFIYIIGFTVFVYYCYKIIIQYIRQNNI